MHSFEAQQRQTRLQAFIDFKVKHPRLEEMDETLMQAIYGHRTYTLLRFCTARFLPANSHATAWPRRGK